MFMPKKIKILIAPVLICLIAALTPVCDASPAKKPDIVFIIVDDLNDWIGCLDGHPDAQTPHLDSLAASGMLFTNAHCNAPQCGPSRESLLRGLYPKSTGKYFNSTKRPEYFGTQPMKGKTSKASYANPIVMHEYFQNNNYRVSSGGKVDSYGRPYMHLDNYLKVQYTSRKKDSFTNDRINLWNDGGPQVLKDEVTGDYKVAQWAIEEWNTASDKPLFMTVGFFRPHRPLNAPKAYFDKFPVADIVLPKVNPDDWDDMPAYAIAMARKHAHREYFEGKYSDHEQIFRMGGVDEWKYMVSSYLACVNYVDAQIGLLLDALKKNPRNRDTIIILSSDHGWHLGEKKHWTKAALWNDATHVPFIVLAPGVEPGTVNNQPISLIDIYPTLTELAGLEGPKHLEGRSIVPLLKNTKLKRDYAYLSYGPENTAVQSERMRYIRYEDGSEELYDHSKDPHEWVNLAKDEKYQKLKNTMKQQVMGFQNH
jgi:arylsulfatase A-like enzyme